MNREEAWKVFKKEAGLDTHKAEEISLLRRAFDWGYDRAQDAGATSKVEQQPIDITLNPIGQTTPSAAALQAFAESSQAQTELEVGPEAPKLVKAKAPAKKTPTKKATKSR